MPLPSPTALAYCPRRLPLPSPTTVHPRELPYRVCRRMRLLWSLLMAGLGGTHRLGLFHHYPQLHLPGCQARRLRYPRPAPPCPFPLLCPRRRHGLLTLYGRAGGPGRRRFRRTRLRARDAQRDAWRRARDAGACALPLASPLRTQSALCPTAAHAAQPTEKAASRRGRMMSA